MRERVPFYRAVYLALLHPDAVLKPSAGRRDAGRSKNANWEAQGRFFHPSWKKTRDYPLTLCLLPSAGFLLTPPLKQIKAPSPSRAHLRGSR